MPSEKVVSINLKTAVGLAVNLEDSKKAYTKLQNHNFERADEFSGIAPLERLKSKSETLYCIICQYEAENRFPGAPWVRLKALTFGGE